MRRWTSALVCAVAAFVVLPMVPALAHAGFLGSDPVDGSVVAQAPPVVRLRFSDEVFASASSATLVHPGSVTITGLRLSTTNDGRTLTVTLPKLGQGAYILRFIAVDPADLHKTSGSISFGVGTAAPPSESGEQFTSAWWSIVVRVIADAALLLCVGAAVIALLADRSRTHDLGNVVRLCVVSGAVVAVGWIVLLIADASTVGVGRVRWASLVLHSDPGLRALVGVQLSVGLWWSSRVVRRGGGRRAQAFVVQIMVVIAIGFIVAASYGGHAGIGGAFALGVMLRVSHLMSLAVWIGAVAALWWLSRRDVTMRSLWPKVSALAAIGLALTGASGLLLSGRVVVSITALLGSTYGRWIVTKAGLLIVLAGLGGLASRRVRRGDIPPRLGLELCVAGVAIMFASLLASSAPALGDQYLALPPASPQIVTADVRDLTVSASIEPARPGPNVVEISVLDTRRPSPGPVSAVVLRLVGADGTTVAERDGVPAVGFLEWNDVNVPSPGEYRVEVGLTRSPSPVSNFVATWTIDRAPVPRVRRVLSTRAWAQFAAALAAMWVVLIALVQMAYCRWVRTTDTDEPRGRSSRDI